MVNTWWATVALALAFTFGSPAAPSIADTAASTARKPAPEFSLQNAKGAAVRLSDFKGKVVLLNFWATWCHGCKTEIPWFVEFQSRFGKDGLAVVGVSMDKDGWGVINPFIAERKLNYTILLGNESLGNTYQVGEMPKSLLIDRLGKVAHVYQGVVDRENCQLEIKSLLAER